MQKKTIILVLFFIGSLIVCGGIFLNKSNNIDSKSISANLSEVKQKAIKIATCPTCFEKAKKINNKKYNIIKTGSTAESVKLLKNGEVDAILAGRTLKPSEPQLKDVLIKEGYSFLNDQSKIVYLNQLKDYKVYTDLDPKELKNIFPVHKIERVEDVYKYLSNGIIITSWENTDFSRANTVHLLERNGKRVNLSRRIALYCLDDCNEEVQDLVLLLKENNN